MSSVVIAGDVSGSVTLQAPSAAGSTVINLPSTLGNTGASSFATTDASGNLGLGVTPSSWATLKAASIGATGSSVAGNSNGVYLTQSAYYNAGWKYSQTGVYAGMYQIVDNTHSWSIAGTGTAGNAITFTQAMTLDASGNLQVGMTSGSRKLSLQGVFGAYHTAGTNDNQFLMYNDGVVSGLSATYGSTGVYTPIAFYTSDVRRMTLDTSGNLGIGTSSPTKTLTVYGAGDYTDEGSPLATFGSTATGSQRIYFGVNNTNNYTYIGSVKSGQAYSNLVLQPNGGNLLVGTTNASGYSGVIIAATSSIGIKVGTASGTQVLFLNSSNSATVGSITSTTTTTSYNTSSDYRLKENIAPMTGALSVVQQLNPVTYNWKVDGSEGQGFIAHELAAIVPDCVHGAKDAVDADGNPVYQGIDTSFLVATLTAAIQELAAASVEQQALITHLQADVAALKGQA